MKKKLSITLLKNLIHSDFLLIEKKIDTKLRAPVIALDNKFLVLDPLILIKNIKQYVRLLQFLKNQKDPLLFLFVQNKQYLNFLNFNIKNSFKTLPVSLDGLEINSNSKEQTRCQTKMITLFDNFLSTEQLIHRGFNKNFFLINSFNSSKKKKSYGIYKVCNEINSLKKIVFVLSIITQVYRKK